MPYKKAPEATECGAKICKMMKRYIPQGTWIFYSERAQRAYHADCAMAQFGKKQANTNPEADGGRPTIPTPPSTSPGKEMSYRTPSPPIPMADADIEKAMNDSIELAKKTCEQRKMPLSFDLINTTYHFKLEQARQRFEVAHSAYIQAAKEKDRAQARKNMGFA